MRIGIFGGSFNPPHLGHLNIAKEVAKKLNIKKIILLPSGNPPHKIGLDILDAKHRLSMLKLATKGQDEFIISEIEINRKGYTYTIDTLRELNCVYGGKYNFFYLIGADSLENLSKWKDYEELSKLCKFVVVLRKGYTKESLEEMILKNQYNAEVVDINCVDVSSTYIRDSIKNNKNVSGLISPKVEEYIRDNNLYRK